MDPQTQTVRSRGALSPVSSLLATVFREACVPHTLPITLWYWVTLGFTYSGDRLETECHFLGLPSLSMCVFPPSSCIHIWRTHPVFLSLCHLPSTQYMCHRNPREVFLFFVGFFGKLFWIGFLAMKPLVQGFHGSPINRRTALTEAQVGA